MHPAFTLLPVPWEPLPPGVSDVSLRRIIEEWNGTPYWPNAQSKGLGVDCVRFVCGVLDELLGKERTDTPLLPPDVALTKPDTAVSAMKLIVRRYGGFRVENGAPLQPGDVVVAGCAGPGHGLIVGPDRSTLWHASQPKVVMTGWAVGWKQRYFGAYRMPDRKRWDHESQR